jgi:hypothetical protein
MGIVRASGRSLWLFKGLAAWEPRGNSKQQPVAIRFHLEPTVSPIQQDRLTFVAQCLPAALGPRGLERWRQVGC